MKKKISLHNTQIAQIPHRSINPTHNLCFFNFSKYVKKKFKFLIWEEFQNFTKTNNLLFPFFWYLNCFYNKKFEVDVKFYIQSFFKVYRTLFLRIYFINIWKSGDSIFWNFNDNFFTWKCKILVFLVYFL